MIDGTVIKLGEKEYLAPPLNLKSMRVLLPRIQQISSTALPTADDLGTITDTMHASLLRNYPDISKETVEEGLDMGNIGQAMQAVLGASGLVSGNAMAMGNPLTGQNSTGTSSPQQDGPTTM